MKPPKVSVLMTVLDGERYLRAALDSLRAQSLWDFEVVVVDDGSTDGTPAILAAYAERDPRFRVIRNETNLGIPRSANRGLAACRGDYVAGMDADDLAHPDRLAKQAAFLDAHPEAALVSCWFETMSREGRAIERVERDGDPDAVAWYLAFHNHIGGLTMVMYRRALGVKVGGYDPGLRHVEDWALWLRLSREGEAHILPAPLIRYRVHEQNMSVVHKPEQRALALGVLKEQLTPWLDAPPDDALAAALQALWRWEVGGPEMIDPLHTALSRAFQGFAAERAERLQRNPGAARRIREQVGRHFLHWAEVLRRQGHPRAALLALHRASLWLRFRGARHAIRAAEERLRAVVRRGGSR